MKSEADNTKAKEVYRGLDSYSSYRNRKRKSERGEKNYKQGGQAGEKGKRLPLKQHRSQNWSGRNLLAQSEK